MKNVRRNEGFTLVELMVVVAIIGILSAVAIPNFKRYQAKSKTSEAKLQLAALYTAEMALQSEYDHYGSCLIFAGYSAPMNNFYSVGFTGAAASNASIRANQGNDCLAADPFQFGAVKLVGGTMTVVGDIAATSIVNGAGTSFTAEAVGYVSSDFAAAGTTDIWTINEQKTIDHGQFGF